MRALTTSLALGHTATEAIPGFANSGFWFWLDATFTAKLHEQGQGHNATSMRWTFWYRDTVCEITLQFRYAKWPRIAVVIIIIGLLLLAYGAYRLWPRKMQVYRLDESPPTAVPPIVVTDPAWKQI